jgi:hypothetical protein
MAPKKKAGGAGATPPSAKKARCAQIAAPADVSLKKELDAVDVQVALRDHSFIGCVVKYYDEHIKVPNIAVCDFLENVSYLPLACFMCLCMLVCSSLCLDPRLSVLLYFNLSLSPLLVFDLCFDAHTFSKYTTIYDNAFCAQGIFHT